MTPSTAPEPLDRRDVLAIVPIATAAVGLPLWLAAAAGAIGLPSNDDWVYMVGATGLFRTGVIEMPGHTTAAIGQLLMVQPLLWLSGGERWAFTAFGLAMGLLFVVTAYLLARRFVGRGSAVLATLVLLAFPGLVRLMATFMTDVPACALMTLSLLLGVIWLQGQGRGGTLVASVLVGIAAVGIREFSVAAPTAILVAGWARNRKQDRVLLAGVSIGLVAAFGAIVLLANSSSRGEAAAVHLTPSLHSVPAFMTLAAALLPVLAVAIGRRLRDLRASHLIAAGGLVAMGVVVVPQAPFVGNIWSPDGATGDAVLIGGRDFVIAPRLWLLSEQLALMASVLLAALVLRRASRWLLRIQSPSAVFARVSSAAVSREAPLGLFLLAYAAGLVLYGSLFPILDRYLLPMIPPATVLLLPSVGDVAVSARNRAFAHAAFAWLALSAVLVATNSFAFDVARWRAGERAVAMGYSPQTVDAGYEWVGFHGIGMEVKRTESFDLTWYDDLWPSFRPCAVLSTSPMDDARFQLVRADPSAYRNNLFFGPSEPLYLYGALDTACPTPPRAVLPAPLAAMPSGE